MPPPSLIICGYSEAAMLLRGSEAPNVSAIISIHGQREFGVEYTCAHRLDLHFDDADIVEPGDMLAWQKLVARQRENRLNGLVEIAPCEADVRAIIGFAERVSGLGGSLLIHCAMGISRSTATGLICLAVWNGPGSEAECVRELYMCRACASPHRGMVRLADRLLHREGKLIHALQAMKARIEPEDE